MLRQQNRKIVHNIFKLVNYNLAMFAEIAIFAVFAYLLCHHIFILPPGIEKTLLYILPLFTLLTYKFKQDAVKRYSLLRNTHEAKKNIELARNVEEELINNDIYKRKTERKRDNDTKIDVYTPITVKPDFSNGSFALLIRNASSYQSKLEKLDLSSVLDNYIVETSVFTKDKNWLRLTLFDTNIKAKVIKCVSEYNRFKTSHKDIVITDNLALDVTHSLVTGVTGSGKTYAFYHMILSYIAKYDIDKMFIIDPKNADLAIVGEHCSEILDDDTHVAINKEQILKTLRTFDELVEKQKIEVKERIRESNQTGATYRDFNIKPLLLIFDEYTSFASQLKTWSKKERDEVIAILDKIILQGRQFGAFMWLGMQKADSTTIDTKMRDNLLFKCVLGQATSTQYQTTFERQDIESVDFDKGEGYFMLQGLTAEPRFVHFPYLQFFEDDISMLDAIDMLSKKVERE